MSAGCAVITSDANGCAEVVGDTGITTPVRNSSEIRRALDQLMRDNTLSAQLGNKAMERVKQFSWPNISAQYLRAFEQAIDHAKTLGARKAPWVKGSESAQVKKLLNPSAERSQE
jgi:glycosyltransferase involved in cell wall biosynthesis